MSFLKLLVPLTMVIFILGCGDTTVTPEDDENGVSGPIDPYADPPDYQGDPFADFDTVIGMGVPSETDMIEDEEILTGTHYTVQISAAAAEETANRLSESVAADVNHPVFVDLEGSYWKVRVGAFPARSDAEEYRSVLVHMGFSDAWVVTREP